VNTALAGVLARASSRFFRRHPAQLILSFVGIVLGVGIVTAVLITNTSSRRAFALSTDALYGRTTHQIVGADGVDGREYADLRRRQPALAMVPIVEGQLALAGELFTLLGIEPFAEATFGRSASGSAFRPDDDALFELLFDDDAIGISAGTQARLSLPLRESLPAEANGHTRFLRIVGEFTSSNPAASEGLLLADIAVAQRLLGLGSSISRIDLILTPEQVTEVMAALPPHLRLDEAATRERTMRAMTRGFQINLTAMSLLALVVGAFLIHNTMTFAVLQRRELYATLRISGVTSRAILASVLAEALVIGTAGSIAGIALGHAIAQALISLTTRTINDLYFVLHVQEVWFSPWLAAGGLALGIGSSVAAASTSAFDAAAVSPAQAQRRSLAEHRVRRMLPRLGSSGIVIMCIGVMLALLPLQSLVAGFAAMMLLIGGYGLALPAVILGISRALARPASRLGTAVAHAVGSIERNISRTGLAIAALAIAVSATFGVEIMITSFRQSVDDWLGMTLQSDLYVSGPTTVSSQASSPLVAGVESIVASTPGVAAYSTGRVVKVATDVGQLDMLVLAPHAASSAGFEFLSGDADASWQRLLQSDSVLISEPLATKHNLDVDDTVSLFTARAGEQPFRVAGIVRDYGSSHGRLTIVRERWAAWWDDERISSLGIMVADDTSPEQVLERLRSRLSTTGKPLDIRSNDAIHERSLDVFDRTFEVTRVLRWLTVGVAFVGIFSALLALHLERAREFAILRACGATRLQVAQTVFAQTLFMGLLAGLLSLPLGWAMSEILIRVINLRSFGWSMQSHLPPRAALSAIGLACTAALLAGVYPAWRLALAAVGRQLREE